MWTHINHVYTIEEAAFLWNTSYEELKRMCEASNIFNSEEARLSGNTYLITTEGMVRIFGKSKKQIFKTIECEAESIKNAISDLKKRREYSDIILKNLNDNNKSELLQTILKLTKETQCEISFMLPIFENKNTLDQYKDFIIFFAKALIKI